MGPLQLNLPVAAADWLVPLAPAFLDSALKAVAILAVAGLATQLMRKASAASRHMVWTLALLAVLVLPALSLTLPGLQVLPTWVAFTPATTTDSTIAADIDVPMEQTPLSGEFEVTKTPVADPVMLTAAHDGVSDANPITLSPEMPEIAGETAIAVAPGTAEPLAPPAEVFTVRDGLFWATIIWAAGAMVCLLPIMLGHLGLRRLERTTKPATGDMWQRLSAEIAAALGLTRNVTLLRSETRAMPMIWGLFRPRLLLPADCDTWCDDRRRVVLLHEMAHAMRWDCLIKFVGHLVCALHWFNPLVWFAFKRMQNEAERACDDLVLSSGSVPGDYANHILEIARDLRSGLLTAHSSIAMARPGSLEGRLLAILDPKQSRRKLTRTRILIAAVLVAAIVVPISILKATSPGDISKDSDTPTTEEPASIDVTDSANEDARDVTCAGRVIDENGKPLAGITVEVYQQNRWLAIDQQATVRQTAKTDKAGRFSATFSTSEDTAWGYALARPSNKAYGWAVWMNHAKDLSSDPVIIRCGKPTKLSGIVIDKTGKPIANATVRPILKWQGGGWTLAGCERMTVHTAADGKFAIEGVPTAARAEFIVSADGYAEICTGRRLHSDPWSTYAAGQSGIRITLGPEAGVKGTVVDTATGKGVGGVKFSPVGAGTLHRQAQALCTSRADGSFELNGLQPGKYSVYFKHPEDRTSDWVGKRVSFICKAGEVTEGVKVSVFKGPIVSVKVLDAETKHPIYRAQVSTSHGEWYSCYTDRNGIARIRVLPGKYSIRVWENMHIPHGDSNFPDADNPPRWINVSNGKDTSTTIMLKPLAIAHGVVVDEGGKPIAGASVFSGGQDPLITDTEGKFQGCVVGEVDGSKGYAFARHEQRNLAGRAKITDPAKPVRIKLTTGGRIAGSVVDPAGKGIPGVKISISLRVGRSVPSLRGLHLTTDTQGRFEAKAIPPGEKYTVSVRSQGFGRDSAKFAIRGSERVQIRPLKLSPANLSIEGIVVYEDGKPADRANVSTGGDQQPDSGRMTTGPDGKFKISGLVAAKIRLHAYATPRGKGTRSGTMAVKGGDKNIRLVIGPPSPPPGGWKPRKPARPQPTTQPTTQPRTTTQPLSSYTGSPQKRYFVRLVVDGDSVWFQGKKTAWGQVPELLKKVTNRKLTVLQIAMASGDVTIRQRDNGVIRAKLYAAKFGFEYPSEIGTHPTNSVGSPTQTLDADEAAKRASASATVAKEDFGSIAMLLATQKMNTPGAGKKAPDTVKTAVSFVHALRANDVAKMKSLCDGKWRKSIPGNPPGQTSVRLQTQKVIRAFKKPGNISAEPRHNVVDGDLAFVAFDGPADTKDVLAVGLAKRNDRWIVLQTGVCPISEIVLSKSVKIGRPSTGLYTFTVAAPPLIKRTLVDIDVKGDNAGIDLDSGKSFTTPSRKKQRAGVKKWFADTGVDMSMDTKNGQFGLICPKTVTLAMMSNTNPPASIESELKEDGKGFDKVLQKRGMKVYITKKDTKPPIKLMFRTSKGTSGFMLITDLKMAKPAEISFGYRLLPKTKPPAKPHTPPKAAKPEPKDKILMRVFDVRLLLTLIYRADFSPPQFGWHEPGKPMPARLGAPKHKLGQTVKNSQKLSQKAQQEARANKLIKAIHKRYPNMGWNGTSRTIESLDGQIVVRQTKKNLDTIDHMLKKLRYQHSVHVRLKAHVIVASPGTPLPSLLASQPKDGGWLNDKEVSMLLKNAENNKGYRTMAFPSMTIRNGQAASSFSGKMMAHILADKTPTELAIVGNHQDGIAATYEATFSADYRRVTLKINNHVSRSLNAAGRILLHELSTTVSTPGGRTLVIPATLKVSDSVGTIAADGTVKMKSTPVSPSKEMQERCYFLITPVIILPDTLESTLSHQRREGFTKLVERTVLDGPHRRDFLLDLDTGKVLTPPHKARVKQLGGKEQWMKDNGIDAIGGNLEAGDSGIMSTGMVVVKLKNSDWNTISRNDITKHIDRIPYTPAATAQMRMSTLPGRPATYYFRTREGATGLLQVVSLDRKKKSTKIRYKLLRTDESQKCHFVRAVFNGHEMTFQGKPVFRETLAAALKKVPDRHLTVLEVALAAENAGKIPAKQVKLFHKEMQELVDTLGFDYMRNVGVKRMGSLGSPSRTLSGLEVAGRRTPPPGKPVGKNSLGSLLSSGEIEPLLLRNARETRLSTMICLPSDMGLDIDKCSFPSTGGKRGIAAVEEMLKDGADIAMHVSGGRTCLICPRSVTLAMFSPDNPPVSPAVAFSEDGKGFELLTGKGGIKTYLLKKDVKLPVIFAFRTDRRAIGVMKITTIRTAKNKKGMTLWFHMLPKPPAPTSDLARFDLHGHNLLKLAAMSLKESKGN